MFADDTVTKFFTTYRTGNAAAFADSLPTVTIIRNGIDTAVPVTVAATLITGQYSYSFSVPANWVRGDEVAARIAATIDSTNVSIPKDLGEIEEAVAITLSAAERIAIADEVLKRGASNVDGQAEQGSFYSLLQAAFKSTRPTTDGNQIIFESDGVTVHMTVSLDMNEDAEPVVGAS